MVSLVLQAENAADLAKFKADQSISVAVQVAELNLGQIRQYSLSNATDKNTCRITVKREHADEYKQKVTSPTGYISMPE